jgi:hypothetical protein
MSRVQLGLCLWSEYRVKIGPPRSEDEPVLERGDVVAEKLLECVSLRKAPRAKGLARDNPH